MFTESLYNIYYALAVRPCNVILLRYLVLLFVLEKHCAVNANIAASLLKP